MRNHTETAQIIQLFAPRPKPGKRMVPIANHSSNPQCEGDVSDTAENFRLRQERYYAWRKAASIMDYWHAAMKMKSAISYVQNYGAPEGDMHEFVTDETHGAMVNKYRLAWCKLMLTPAPNAGEVRWKRTQLYAEKWKYTGLTAERIEQAIEADVAFLEAHPTRKGGRKPSNSGQQQ